MKVFEALRTLLGLPMMAFLRLPKEQGSEVDIAYVPRPGVGPTRRLGSAPVVGGPPGVTHDGGVLWWSQGLAFRFRARDDDDATLLAAYAAARRVVGILNQYPAGSKIVGDVDFVGLDAAEPFYIEQDDRGRAVLGVLGEAEWGLIC